jgi:tRNA pseudouridine55 synthase
VIPRALDPTGVILVDKPAGPSSFKIVGEVRRRTGARTGHTGTLDPFATGLLVLLSGRATRLAPQFVGLDKRYLRRRASMSSKCSSKGCEARSS